MKDFGLVLATLVLVMDPFGNLPFVVAVLGRLSGRRYARAVVREGAIAMAVLFGFALAGGPMLAWFGIAPAALHVAGGVVLFLIALKMIFGRAAEIVREDEALGDDPVLFPIATPAIAGPSAAATVLFFTSRQGLELGVLLGAIAAACAFTMLVLLAGRPLAAALGARGLAALEKLAGMILSVVAVNMVLQGLAAYWTELQAHPA